MLESIFREAPTNFCYNFLIFTLLAAVYVEDILPVRFIEDLAVGVTAVVGVFQRVREL